MRAGIIAGGVVGLVILAVAASKANAATATPATPAKPKTPVKPTITTVGLPGEVAKIIKEAMASNDPGAIRDAANKIAMLYPVQAADLLNLATILESEPEPTPATGGATGNW
jgi:hypothetical protein